MTKRYKVTIYNQHAACGIWAEGRSERAGPEHITCGEDKSWADKSWADHSAVAHALFAQCRADMGRAFSIYQNSHAGIGLAIERADRI